MSFPYTLSEAADEPALGLIVLQADETIELEFRHYFATCDAPLFVARIPSGAELNPESIAQMKTDLPKAASLLPQGRNFAAVGYACTSGATLIGVDEVRRLVRQECTAQSVWDPLTSAIAAMRNLGVAKLGLVSPYVASVSAPVVDAFEQAGFEVRRAVHFGEETEARVARIAEASIVEAAIQAGSEVDAVFISCTNLRTRLVLPELESRLGVPVLSSNAALAWALARSTGTVIDASGQIFRLG